ncbi:hypothetical protein BST61_g6137 [Cercospora zeina]
MAPDDSAASFRRIPWTARFLDDPDVIALVPNSRLPKRDTEDSLYAEVLKSDRTIRNCIVVYRKPAREEDEIEEATTLYEVGNGMNGHPEIMHGGITSTLIDESMGIMQMENLVKKRQKQKQIAKAEKREPMQGLSAFTAYLNVQYLKPVRTPGAIAVTARRVRREGRKEWVVAELKQWHGDEGSGEVVVCAKGESLWITPKASDYSKL